MEQYPADDPNIESRDPRADLTPEELRKREDNLQPIGDTLAETAEEIARRSAESELSKARRLYIDLQDRASHDVSVDPEELEAARARLIELQEENLRKDGPDEPPAGRP